jgi:hypothetical protein
MFFSSERYTMLTDQRDLLDVLKFELYFLEQGGYERSSVAAWRPRFIFEDSPTCINYETTGDRVPCSTCALMQLVPANRRFATHPCWHIALNESGETLDSLYRHSDQSQVEETVSTWLRAAIKQLEEQRATRLSAPDKPLALPGGSLVGSPLYQTLHPKCANPACPAAFHWTAGGRFFRFRLNPIPEKDPLATADSSVPVGATANAEANQSSCGLHGVKHYWLCEKCCHAFTLVHDDAAGVVLKLLWSQLPAPEVPKDFHIMLDDERGLGLNSAI